VFVRSHHRFLTGFGILLLPFAGAAAASAWQALARKGRPWPWLVPLLLLASEPGRLLWPRDPEQDRSVERDVGRWLGGRLRRGETVASDMPRLVFFAGRRPPEPRPITADEILAMAARPQCRFVAVVRGRTELPAERLRKLGLEPLELPALLSGPAGRARVQVWANKLHR
jgi:hypothetical protein